MIINLGSDHMTRIFPSFPEVSVCGDFTASRPRSLAASPRSFFFIQSIAVANLSFPLEKLKRNSFRLTVSFSCAGWDGLCYCRDRILFNNTLLLQIKSMPCHCSSWFHFIWTFQNCKVTLTKWPFLLNADYAVNSVRTFLLQLFSAVWNLPIRHIAFQFRVQHTILKGYNWCKSIFTCLYFFKKCGIRNQNSHKYKQPWRPSSLRYIPTYTWFALSFFVSAVVSLSSLVCFCLPGKIWKGFVGGNIPGTWSRILFVSKGILDESSTRTQLTQKHDSTPKKGKFLFLSLLPHWHSFSEPLLPSENFYSPFKITLAW